MRGGQRDTEEVFPNYAMFLHSDIWPSIRDGRKDLEHIDVNEMPPQRAAACLAKLVRWARFEPSGEISVIDDIDLREEETRSSVLGRHLAARSLGLTEPMLHALFGDVGQGKAVEPNVVGAELFVLFGERYPAWGERERYDLAHFVSIGLDERFVIKERSKDA